MKKEQIHDLLEKYWSCETSVQDEKVLQAYFAAGDVAEEFKQYIPLFSFIKEGQSVMLSDGFDAKLLEKINLAKKDQYITIRLFRPLLRIAVSILLLIGVGISFYLIAKQDNRPHFVETFEDPNAAMQHAVFALKKLSHAIEKSEMVSAETILYIDELNIDWEAIDSLHKINTIAPNHLK